MLRPRAELFGALEEAAVSVAQALELDLPTAQWPTQDVEAYLAYLRGRDLSYADLRGEDLRGVDFRGASLFGASLEGADLRGARLDNVSLQLTTYTRETRWPEGFDPQSHGFSVEGR